MRKVHTIVKSKSCCLKVIFDLEMDVMLDYKVILSEDFCDLLLVSCDKNLL